MDQGRVHGDPEAAFVGLAVSDASEMIFDSLTDTRKMRNIQAHPRVRACRVPFAAAPLPQI